MSQRLALGAVAGALLALAAGSPAAAAVDGCEDLTVVPAGQGALRVVVPASLGLVDLPSSSFTAVRDGADVPVLARRRPATELAVSLVLVSSDATSPAERTTAQAAALELLVGLPDGARVALVASSAREVLVAPLSADRGPAVQGLSGLDLTGVTDDRATSLALDELPDRAPGHLVILSDDRTAEPTALPAGSQVQVHRLYYGTAAAEPVPASTPTAGTGCPSGARVALLPAVDAVLRRLQGEYDVQVPPGGTVTAVRLDYRAVRAVATLPGASTPSPPGQAAPATSPAADLTGPTRAAAALIGVVALVQLADLLRRRSRRGPRAAAP